MAFDPTLPADHAQIVAAELRNQLNALNDALSAYSTTADMEQEIFANSAGNVATLAKLNMTVSNPPTQAQMQAIADKVDEFITLAQRP